MRMVSTEGKGRTAVHPHHPVSGIWTTCKLRREPPSLLRPFADSAGRLFNADSRAVVAALLQRPKASLNDEGPPGGQTLAFKNCLAASGASEAGAPGDHDDVPLHPLKRAPTAFQSTTSKALMYRIYGSGS